MEFLKKLFNRKGDMGAGGTVMPALAEDLAVRGVSVERHGALFVVRGPQFRFKATVRRPRYKSVPAEYARNRRLMGDERFERWIDQMYDTEDERTAENTVTTIGVNTLITSFFKNTAPPTAWYVGCMKGSAPTVDIADTMASHAGWTEIAGSDVTEANRQTFVGGTVAAGAVDNSASKARYTGNASWTAQGLFMVDNNTIGGGTGTLYSGAAYAEGSAAMQSGYLLDLQATVQVTAG